MAYKKRETTLFTTPHTPFVLDPPPLGGGKGIVRSFSFRVPIITPLILLGQQPRHTWTTRAFRQHIGFRPCTKTTKQQNIPKKKSVATTPPPRHHPLCLPLPSLAYNIFSFQKFHSRPGWVVSGQA